LLVLFCVDPIHTCCSMMSQFPHLSTAADLFAPSCCNNSVAAEHLDHGLLIGDPADSNSKSVLKGFIKHEAAATPKTRSPSLSIRGDESDGEDGVFCVRNTFIDVDSGEDGGLQAVEMHESGARTWAVSMLNLGSDCQQQQSSVASDNSCSTPPACGSPESTWEDAESPFLLATPSGSLSMAAVHDLFKRHGLAAGAPQRDSSPEAARPHQPSDSGTVTAQEPSPTMVLLQVPLQLHCGSGTPFCNGSVDASVAVLNQEQDSVTGSVSLQLRVVLRPHDRSTRTPSPATLPPQLQRAPTADAPHRHPTPGEVAAQKKDFVCCHWKKGWCKLGESCRFKHPVETRSKVCGTKDVVPPQTSILCLDQLTGCGIDAASTSLVAGACAGVAAATEHPMTTTLGPTPTRMWHSGAAAAATELPITTTMSEPTPRGMRRSRKAIHRIY